MELNAYRHARIIVQNARTSVVEAALAMRTNQVGAIVVTDRDAVIGIVTDRDLALRVVAEGRDPRATRLRDVMSPHVATLSPDADHVAAVRLMTEQRARRVPLVEGGRVVGMVTLDDLVLERAVTLSDLRAIVGAQIIEAGPARTRRFDEWRSLERRYARAVHTWSELIATVQAKSDLAERTDAERAIEIVLEGVVCRIEPALAKRFTARLPVLVLARLHALPAGPDETRTRDAIERSVAKELAVGPAEAAEVVRAVGAALARSVGASDALGRRLPPDLRGLFSPAFRRRAATRGSRRTSRRTARTRAPTAAR